MFMLSKKMEGGDLDDLWIFTVQKIGQILAGNKYG
jgi:hypothetical protein